MLHAASQVVVYKLCAPHGAIAKVDLTKDSASKTTTASVQFRFVIDVAQGDWCAVRRAKNRAGWNWVSRWLLLNSSS